MNPTIMIAEKNTPPTSRKSSSSLVDYSVQRASLGRIDDSSYRIRRMSRRTKEKTLAEPETAATIRQERRMSALRSFSFRTRHLAPEESAVTVGPDLRLQFALKRHSSASRDRCPKIPMRSSSSRVIQKRANTPAPAPAPAPAAVSGLLKLSMSRSLPRRSKPCAQLNERSEEERDLPSVLCVCFPTPKNDDEVSVCSSISMDHDGEDEDDDESVEDSPRRRQRSSRSRRPCNKKTHLPTSRAAGAVPAGIMMFPTKIRRVANAQA